MPRDRYLKHIEPKERKIKVSEEDKQILEKYTDKNEPTLSTEEKTVLGILTKRKTVEMITREINFEALSNILWAANGVNREDGKRTAPSSYGQHYMDIYVVSNADKVQLFVNGKSQGFGQQSYRFLFTFSDIEWQAGVIEAIGYDTDDRKICQTQKKTAGEPAAIRLTPRTSPKGLLADGSDLALVDVEVVDADGNRNPIALNIINFSLSGPAEWRGGIAQGPDNYILSKTLPVECGVNRVIIRSTTKPGKIVLTAKSGNLKPASVEFVSKKVKVTMGGISV